MFHIYSSGSQLNLEKHFQNSLWNFGILISKNRPIQAKSNYSYWCLNHRCKLTSQIGLTGPTLNKKSQVELICAALNHISLKEPHTHMIAFQCCIKLLMILADFYRREFDIFSAHIAQGKKAYFIFWCYNMGESSILCWNSLQSPLLRLLKTLCCWLWHHWRENEMSFTRARSQL